MAALIGSDSLIAAGGLDGVQQSSLAKIVLDCDQIGALRRYLREDAVDEAHALLGPPPPPGAIIVGTLSKTLGAQGGFVAADRTVVDLCINTARSFIFTTALAPPSAAAALAALTRD